MFLLLNFFFFLGQNIALSEKPYDGDIEHKSVFLKDTNLMVGIGLTKPTANLHIYTKNKPPRIKIDFEAIRNIENGPPGFDPNYFSSWDIVNSGNLIFNSETLSEKNNNILTLSHNGNIGIGTDAPEADLDIKRPFGKKPTIQLQTQDEDNYPMRWLIQQNQSNLLFKFSDDLKGTYTVMQISKTLAPGYDKVVINGELYAEKLNIQNLSIPSMDVDNGILTLTRNDISLRLNASNPHTEIGSGEGVIYFWYPDVGYNNIVVKGIWAKDEIYVQTENPWPDFVFNDDYNLMPLDSLQNFIKKEKHLPDIPTAEQINKDGMPVKEINAKLLQKIEEQTLYIIELQKQINQLKEEVEKLKNEEQ